MDKKYWLFGLLVIWVLSSCSSRKNFVYLQDMEMGKKYLMDTKYEAVIHPNDRLSITVSCKKPELAIPFNIHEGTFRIGEDGSVDTYPEAGLSREKGYRVNVDGDIDFPILGKLHVEGLTVTEVTDLIKTKIQDGNYITDPLVSIEFLNFKYTVLGAVGHNGTFSVDDDRVTLLDAIAKAGDLSSRARVDRVAVIREVGDSRQMFMHDLRSTDLFESPCFYLQQNDIVYVEPKYKEKDNEERGLRYTTLFLSFAAVVCSLIWALK